MAEGTLELRGSLALRRVGEPSVRALLAEGLPHRNLPQEVRAWRLRNLPHLMRGARTVVLARALGIPHLYGSLRLTLMRGDGSVLDYGLASLRVVTNAGVAYLVDALQNLVEPENLRYHGFGTGTAAEAAADTALQTELTTQYNPDNTRPTGSLGEQSANVYRTVATLSPDAGGTIAITEHGIFSQAATGGGTLLDRSVFSAVNVVANQDSLQATYDLTLNAGG